MDALKSDTDRLFSYNTKQQVEVKDRLLGIINYSIMVAVMVYVVAYVFIGERAYLETEPAKGVSVLSFSGDDVSRSAVGNTHSRLWSAEEISYPGISNGNLFVATKVNVQQEVRGVCEDVNKRCMTAEDCTPGLGATCSPSKYCVEPSWCPDGHLEEYKLQSDLAVIWVKSAIIFGHLDPHYMFHTDMSKITMYPQAHHNAYKVTDFLQQCDPPVRFEEVSELGAAIEVQFIWNCQVDSIHNCEKHIFAQRVDTLLDEDHIGFAFEHVEYDPINPDKRTAYKKHGIRFFVSTVGTGSKVSMAMIIFYASTGIALLGIAPIAADLFMTQLMRESKKYHARKYDYTQDFSDYFDEISGIDDVTDRIDELMGTKTEDEADIEADEADLEWRHKFNTDEDPPQF